MSDAAIKQMVTWGLLMVAASMVAPKWVQYLVIGSLFVSGIWLEIRP